MTRGYKIVFFLRSILNSLHILLSLVVSIDYTSSPTPPLLSTVMTEAKPSSARSAWADSSQGWTEVFRACVSMNAGGSQSLLTWPMEVLEQVQTDTWYSTLLDKLSLLLVANHCCLTDRWCNSSWRCVGVWCPPVGHMERWGQGPDPHTQQTCELQPHLRGIRLHPLPL